MCSLHDPIPFKDISILDRGGVVGKRGDLDYHSLNANRILIPTRIQAWTLAPMRTLGLIVNLTWRITDERSRPSIKGSPLPSALYKSSTEEYFTLNLVMQNRTLEANNQFQTKIPAENPLILTARIYKLNIHQKYVIVQKNVKYKHT